MSDVLLGLADAARARAREYGWEHSQARIERACGIEGTRARERAIAAAAGERACCAYERDALEAGACPAYTDPWAWFGGGMEASLARQSMVVQYAWAIPCSAALDAIAARGPVVEVGAGGGYWAMLLAGRGARVAPFDREPRPYVSHATRRCWHPVARSDETRALRMHPERTLLLCWPPYQGPMAERALGLHRGEWVAYIGEGEGGCTATDAFHQRLEAVYALAEVVRLPQWPGLHDRLELWQRAG